ncbi:hypothetical protein GIB67_023976 [Kingdonia uniflora]|uniref:PurT/PurK-like preATP-grasp domain-containing protein n=1 Tax=Kingdonia uniflora TaxID=39325 RepID=A0A7J7LPR2_9MAGN|nr:hypothetical protein GIB67_023976 [Kingdonia uniflora]
MLLRCSSSTSFCGYKHDYVFSSDFRIRPLSPIQRIKSLPLSTRQSKPGSYRNNNNNNNNHMLRCQAYDEDGGSSTRKDVIPVHGLSNTVVGVLGGGQLGRMICQAASQMSIKVMILDPLENCPASTLSYHHVVGSYDDSATVKEFAKRLSVSAFYLMISSPPFICIWYFQFRVFKITSILQKLTLSLVLRCGVVTYEIEHVDVATLEKLEQQGIDCQPKASTIRIIQGVHPKTITILELQAIDKGLDMATGYGYKRIELGCDSASVVTLIKTAISPPYLRPNIGHTDYTPDAFTIDLKIILVEDASGKIYFRVKK